MSEEPEQQHIDTHKTRPSTGPFAVTVALSIRTGLLGKTQIQFVSLQTNLYHCILPQLDHDNKFYS